MWRLGKTELIRINVKTQLDETKENQISYFDNSRHCPSIPSSLIVPGSLDYRHKSTFPYEAIKYKFPHYFQFYFNTVFLILLAPFRIKIVENDEIKAVTYTIQRIACGIVHITNCIVSILQIRRDTSQHLTDNPENVFAICSCLCWACYIIVFSRMVWSKSNLGLFTFPLSQPTQKVMQTLCSEMPFSEMT